MAGSAKEHASFPIALLPGQDFPTLQIITNRHRFEAHHTDPPREHIEFHFYLDESFFDSLFERAESTSTARITVSPPSDTGEIPGFFMKSGQSVSETDSKSLAVTLITTKDEVQEFDAFSHEFIKTNIEEYGFTIRVDFQI